ncbi:hypothetical protein K8R47_01695 [archaeon]|nr:hypothetical protein [archaeon]
MLQISYDEILKKIVDSTGKDRGEIEEKINAKLKELQDLISKEGAAHIIANEYKVKVFDNIPKAFKIKNLVVGMSSVEFNCKVIQVNEIREFTKGDRSGKVASFVAGDETGAVRIVLWDTAHIKEIEDKNLKEETVIKISNAYVKDNNGFKEVHLGNRAKLELNVAESVGEVKVDFGKRDYTKKKITELKEGENNIELMGTIVQLFEPRFYDSCEECGRKVSEESGEWKCLVHGNVAKKITPIVNIYLDDGSENIRVVFFRDNAEKLINNVVELKNDISKFDAIREEVMGKQFKIYGKVVKNDMFDRLEFMANDLEELNPEEVADELVKEIDV